jgi:hypothetical protein
VSAFRARRSDLSNPALRRERRASVRRHGGGVILRPRGPRSCPIYAVSNRHHLLDPIRPTREHIAISPHSGLYAMPSLCGRRRGDPRVVPGFRSPFLLGMPLSMTPGSSIIASPELRCRYGLRRDLSSSALPFLPQSVSRGARISGLPDSRICYGLPSCSPPCTDQTDTLGHRELLLPGFQRIGCPPRCWV